MSEDEKADRTSRDEPERVYKSTLEKLQGKVWIGKDLVCRPESNFLAGDYCNIKLVLPKGYFKELAIDESEELLLFRHLLRFSFISPLTISVRSILAQAGLVPMFPTVDVPYEVNTDEYLFTGALNICNYKRNFILPDEFPVLRPVLIPTQPIKEDKLRIVRVGEFDESVRTVDLRNLPSGRNRAEVDNYLGINWVDAKDYQPRLIEGTQWILGETEPVKLSDNSIFMIDNFTQVTSGGVAVHTNSVLIDQGFSGPVRLEYQTVGNTQLPEFCKVREYSLEG